MTSSVQQSSSSLPDPQTSPQQRRRHLILQKMCHHFSEVSNACATEHGFNVTLHLCVFHHIQFPNPVRCVVQLRAKRLNHAQISLTKRLERDMRRCMEHMSTNSQPPQIWNANSAKTKNRRSCQSMKQPLVYSFSCGPILQLPFLYTLRIATPDGFQSTRPKTGICGNWRVSFWMNVLVPRSGIPLPVTSTQGTISKSRSSVNLETNRKSTD